MKNSDEEKILALHASLCDWKVCKRGEFRGFFEQANSTITFYTFVALCNGELVIVICTLYITFMWDNQLIRKTLFSVTFQNLFRQVETE
jgi:hypothetical protein